MENIKIVIQGIDKATKPIKNIETRLSKMGKKISGVTRSITSAWLPMTVGIAGVGFAIAKVAKTGMDFEQAMKNVQTVAGASTQEFDKLTNFAKKMGETTVFSASESAEAMYFLASAGYKTESIMSSLSGILDLAAATQSDLASTSEIVVSTLNAFGMEASESSRVANVFAAAISNSQLTMERIGVAMPYISGLASSLGMSLEEVTATMGILVSAGVRAESAGRLLASSMSRLLNPSDDAVETLEKYGITLEEVNPSTKSMAEIVDVLNKANMSAADVTKVFGQEGARVWLKLIPAGSKAIREMTKDITGTTKASKMAKEQTDTTAGSLKMLKSRFEALQLKIFEKISPHLVKLFDVIRDKIIPAIEDFVGWISRLFDIIRKNKAFKFLYTFMEDKLIPKLSTMFRKTKELIGLFMSHDWGKIKERIGEALEGARHTIVSFVNEIADKITEIRWEDVISGIENIIGDIKIRLGLESTSEEKRAFVQKITDFLKEIDWSKISAAIQNMFSISFKLDEWIDNSLRGGMDKLNTRLETMFEETWKIFTDTEALDKMAENWADIITEVTTGTTDLTSSFSKSLEVGTKEVERSGFSDTMTKLFFNLFKILGVATVIGMKLWVKTTLILLKRSAPILENAFIDILAKLGKIIGDSLSAIYNDTVIAFINHVIDAINWIWEKLPKKVRGLIGIESLAAYKIPQLDLGSTIQAKIQGLRGNEINSNVTVNINVTDSWALDENKLAKKAANTVEDVIVRQYKTQYGGF
jgi:TP901 family phage tail tape measure protein